MTVIAAVEFYDLVAFCISPRQSQRGHSRFRARVDKTEHLKARHEFHHTFCQLDLQGAGRAIRCAFNRGFLNGLHHLWMSMPCNQRPPREDVIDVTISIHID